MPCFKPHKSINDSLLDLTALKRRTGGGREVALDNTRQPALLLSLNGQPSQEEASSRLPGSDPLKVRSARLAKLTVWIPPIRNSHDRSSVCLGFFFSPGMGVGWGSPERPREPVEPRPLVFKVGVAWDGSVTWEPVPLPRASDAHCPHQGRQLLLQGTCCQASTPEHFGNRSPGPAPPLLSSYARTNGSDALGPDPLPRLPSHALYAGSSSPLRVCIGQPSRPAGAGEGEARPEAYCAGVALGAALRLARTGRSWAQARSCPNAWQDPRRSCLQVSEGWGHCVPLGELRKLSEEGPVKPLCWAAVAAAAAVSMAGTCKGTSQSVGPGQFVLLFKPLITRS